MSRIIISLACALLLANLSACKAPDENSPASAAEQNDRAQPAGAAQRGAPSPESLKSEQIGDEGGSSGAGISADAIARAQAAGAGAGYGAPQVDLSQVNAAIDRVQRANQAMRNGSAPVKPAPATPAASAGLPPAQVKITGDTIVPSAPELAGDVINGIRRVYAAQTECTTIDGIDTKAVSAVGPFNKNAQGRLISGTIIERWSVQGCGKTAAYHVAMKVLADSTVDYAITGA